MIEYFKEQLGEDRKLTEEDLKKFTCKSNGMGGELVPGDIMCMYLLEIKHGTFDENGGENITLQTHRIGSSVINELAKEHEFIRMARSWPVLRKK